MPPVILFDGDCAFCNATVNRVFDIDPDADICFVPLQSTLGRALRQKHAIPDDLQSMIFIDRQRVYVKSDASIALAARLPWPWRAARLGVMLPRPLRDWLYDLFAANRYRLFGHADACRIPSAKMLARTLH